MAKDDYFKIVYVILTELYACKRQGRRVDPEDIGYRRFDIPEGYLLGILDDLLEEGYIKGIIIRRTKGTGGYCRSGLEEMTITMKGIEYLQDNGMMQKIYKALKEVKDCVPGL